jgi:hypothetical protein
VKVLKRIAVCLALVIGVGALVFHPGRPLYMRHTDVEFAAPDGVLLRGTVSFPRWARRPVPGVVLVHGSGRLGREHVVGDVRHLVWRGLAVLSYDKRGVGASSGVYEQRGGDGAEATLRRLAGDAARAFDALSATSGVDRERLGLFGASQAGWVIPLAAELTRTPPKFHVILSGPAVSTGAEQYYSDLTSDGTGPPPVSDRAEVERLTLAFNGRPGFDPLPFLKATRVPTVVAPRCPRHERADVRVGSSAGGDSSGRKRQPYRHSVRDRRSFTARCRQRTAGAALGRRDALADISRSSLT